MDSHKGIHLEDPFADVNTTDGNEPVMTTTAMDSSVNLFSAKHERKENELIGVFWNMFKELYHTMHPLWKQVSLYPYLFFNLIWNKNEKKNMPIKNNKTYIQMLERYTRCFCVSAVVRSVKC